MSSINVAILAAHGLTSRTAATWNPSLPRDPRVLAPIVVDALVIRQKGAKWADTQMKRTDPSGSSIVDAKSLLPKPFAMRATDRDPGAYLHWALPEALTRGVRSDTVSFPALPDRWLISRIFPSATHSDRRAVRSWILQAHDNNPQPIDLDSWHEPGTPPAGIKNPLTALGYGDVSWAGYFDNTQNRLAFYDDLKDVKAGPIAYLVCGWYSDPAQDPLGPAQVSSLTSFNARLQQLGWTLPVGDLERARAAAAGHIEAARSIGLPVTTPRANAMANRVAVAGGFDAQSGVFTTQGSWWPQMTLLHGGVVGIGWPKIGWEGNPLGVWNPQAVNRNPADPSVADPVGGPPDPSTVKVAIGNTITEAMAKLVATDQNRADEARVLEAFQLNALPTLNEPDGAARIDALLHANAFASLPAGETTETIWQPPTSVNRAPPASSPPPNPGVFARYQHGSPSPVAGRPGLGNIAASAAVRTAPKLSAEVLSQIKVVNANLSDIVDQQLAPDPPLEQPGQWVEVKRALPRFFCPTDPILLIEGAKASFKHKPASFSKDGLLYCRLTGDFATAVSAASPPGAASSGRVSVNGADLLERGIENGGTPPECEDLLRELVVLDPGSSVAAAHASAPPSAATAVIQGFTQNFAVEQTAWHAVRDPRIDHAPLLSLSGITGQLPSPISISLPVRPWNPIRLDWQAQYLPSSGGVADWKLGEIDFEAGSAQSKQATIIEGSSPLTQGSTQIVAAAIRNALKQAASAAGSGITDPGTVVAFFSAIAQKAIQGFQQINIATPAAQQGVFAADRLPLDDIASALSDMDVLTGGFDGLNTLLRGGFAGNGAEHPGLNDAAPSPFFGVRAGFLQIMKLRLVDGFGQFVDLLSDAGHPVIISDPMTVPDHADLVALPPRFTSPARLTLRYVDGAGSGNEANLDPKSGNTISPVCGYLMPNHLDGAVEFFGPDGKNIGFVRPDGDSAVVWEEAPGIPSTVGQDPARAISNSFAAGIANGLLRWGIRDAGLEPGKDTALQAFLRLIDSVLWSVDPYGHTGDEHLALLVGHPVVIARARLRLEVQEPIHPEITNLTLVPVRLGALAHWQDGLFGYFVNDDYATLHCSDAAAAGLARAVGPNQGFLQPINLVPDHFNNFVADTGSTPVDHPYVDTSGVIWVHPNQNVDLTLLIEPHTAIHATTGFLPRKDIGLRREWIADALAKLSPTFRFGPLLVDPQRIRMPLATDIRGTWSWDYRADANTWAELPITNTTQDALLPPDPPSGIEGWMRLSPP
jgi:hypothetical protein